MKLTPLARAAALDLSSRLGITFQQAIGGLVLLADIDGSITTDALYFHLMAAFGLVDQEDLPHVVEHLMLGGILSKDEQPGWWEVALP